MRQHDASPFSADEELEATQANELMISTLVHSPAAQRESLERVRALFPKDLPRGHAFSQ